MQYALCCAGMVLLKGETSLPKYDRRREGAIKEYEDMCARRAQCNLCMSQFAFPQDLWRVQVHQMQCPGMRDLKARTFIVLEGCMCLSLVLWELVTYIRHQVA
ncbi:hypothetical protein ABBQ38_008506 [Trebouxia sp. C0009 RCD-2024]